MDFVFYGFLSMKYGVIKFFWFYILITLKVFNYFDSFEKKKLDG